MMKKILISFLLLFAIQQTVVIGQEQTSDSNQNKFKHALGFAAGFTTGYGLSYRYFPNKFGAQLTFAPYKDDYETQISLGVAFLYKLIEAEKTTLYIYQGTHYSYDKYENEDAYYWDSYTNSYIYEEMVEVLDEYFNVGVGFGVELLILKRFSFNLMGGYAGFENFERISLTGETGIYYKF